jgi:hypothetical protein
VVFQRRFYANSRGGIRVDTNAGRRIGQVVLAHSAGTGREPARLVLRSLRMQATAYRIKLDANAV